MISKFLYDVDEKGKKVLYGLLEDEVDEKFEVGSELDYSFIGDEEVDDAIRNLGGLCYAVFNDNGVTKYLDVDFYKDKAKIQLTDKIAYATALSEDIIDVILDYLDTNLKYETVYSCYFEHPKKGTVDSLEKLFKGLFTDSFVQVIKDDISYYLTQDVDYKLTRDFKEAKKFHKTDIRKILIINKFVDKETPGQTVYFSPYQMLRGEDEFFLLKPNPVMVSKVDNQFIIKTDDVKIKDTHLLCKSERINGIMKEISSLLNKDEEMELGYAMCYGSYLNKNDNIYTLSNDPKDLSLLSKSDISFFSILYQMFSESKVEVLENKPLMYLYEVEENIFKVTNNTMDTFLGSRLVSEKNYFDFMKLFYTKKMPLLDKGYILTTNNQYINLEVLDDNQFKLEYSASSYNATVFTLEQASNISKLLDVEVSKRELNNLFDPKKYNINKGYKNFIIEDEYKKLLSTIKKSKFKVFNSNKIAIKIESEKGAFEYLRKFYYKSIMDAEILFEKLLLDESIKNILIVESLLNLDLIAINNVVKRLNRVVDVTLINTYRMGYYPEVNLCDSLNVKAIYRVAFTSMPKIILSSFDSIVFSKGFSNEVAFDSIIMDIIDSQEITLANIKFCNLDKTEDCFAKLFSKVKRKYFKDYDASNIINISREMFDDLEMHIYNSNASVIEVPDPIIEKEFSYHSLLKIKNKKIIDLHK